MNQDELNEIQIQLGQIRKRFFQTGEIATRPFPEKIPHFDYDLNYKVLKVTQNGAIR